MPASADSTDIERLLAIMARLRDPQRGCAWDLRQTYASIAPYTIEEAYEVADAIAAGDLSALRDELGDLLLQVVFHAQLASEEGAFAFADVARAISDKLVRRHPHVFGNVRYRNDAEQRAAWERIKAEERGQRNTAADDESDDPPGVLDGVAGGLPALTRADKLQRKAAAVGFDWDAVEPVFAAVAEELDELRDAYAQCDATAAAAQAVTEEFGDLLFACVNLARHLRVDADVALRRATHKFERRFRFIETSLNARQRRVDEADAEELDVLWRRAKRSQD